MAFQHWGFKRIGGVGLNGQIYRWEDLGGGLYRAHCSPGVAMATRIVSLPGGESYTDVYPFYCSGNVVTFPPAFDPFGAAGNTPNNALVGTTAYRARRGDSWHPLGVPGLAGLRFWIERAEAGAGDDFSEATSNRWLQAATLGPMIRLDDLTAAGDVKIEVTDVETNYTGSTPGDWHSLGSLIVDEILNRDRDYVDDVDPFDPSAMRVNWDRAVVSNGDPIEIATAYNGGAGNVYRTVLTTDAAHGLSAGDVIEVTGSNTNPVIDGRQTVHSVVDSTTVLLEHTGLIDGGTAGTFQPIGIEHLAVVGSHAFTFNKAFLGVLSVSTGALVLGANRVRISFTADGVAQTPREAVIRSPYMTFSVIPENTTGIGIWRQDRQTGEWIAMQYAGASINPYDPFLNYGVNEFKFNEDANEVYFHPLLAGDNVVAVFITAEPVGMDSFGEPGIFFKPYQYPIVDRTYLKHCDILDIRDEAGVLAAAGDLTGYEFNIGSHGVFRGPSEVRFGEVPNNPATELSDSDFVEMPCNGKLLILEDGYQTLRNAGRYSNIRVEAGWMHREGMLHPDVIRMYVDGIGCLDTVRGQFSNGASSWGEIGLQNIGYDSYTYYEPGQGGNPYPWGAWKGNGAPTTRGIANSVLPVSEDGLDIFKLSNLTDPAKNVGDIDPGNMSAGNFSPSGTFVIGTQQYLGGVSSVVGFIGGAVWIIDSALLRHFPKGTTIVQALLEMRQVGEVSFDQNAWDERTQVPDPGGVLAAEAGYGTWANDIWYPDGSLAYPVNTQNPTTPQIGFGIIGQRASGTWDSLGSFVEANSGTLEQNQTRVINVTSTVQALCDLRNSPYKQIAVHLATVNGVASTVPSVNGDYNFGLLENIITGWSSFGATQNGYELDGWTPKWDFYGHAKALVSNSSIQFGAFIVQFRLPDNTLKAFRYVYGNMPPMG